MRLARVTAVLVALLQTALGATAAEQVFREDFQAYELGDTPTGWVVVTGSEGDGWHVHTDPTIGYRADRRRGAVRNYAPRWNRSYGITQEDASESITVLASRAFDAPDALEIRGRFLLGTQESEASVLFHASSPAPDDGYRLRASVTGITLYTVRDGSPSTLAVASLELEERQWYRWHIRAVDYGGATLIKARVWRDGEPEPSEWLIETSDRSRSKRTAGHLGLISIGSGGVFFDDLSLAYVAREGAPQITILESGELLHDGAIFNRDAAPEIRVIDDDDPSPVWSAALDGSGYSVGDAVDSEGPHVLEVFARDAGGRQAYASRGFTIDKTPPDLHVSANGISLTDGAAFGAAVSILAEVSDITAVTLEMELDGTSYTAGTLIEAPGSHTFLASARDAAGWVTSVGPLTFRIDLNPPQLTLDSHESEALIGSADVILAGSSGTAETVTVNGIEAEIDRVAMRWSLATRLAEGLNELLISGESGSGARSELRAILEVDTIRPTIALVAPAGGECLRGEGISVTARASDTNLESVLLTATGPGGEQIAAPMSAEGDRWGAGLPRLAEGAWRLIATATDGAGHGSSTSTRLTVDRTEPSIEILENGQPLESIYPRSVTPQITISDSSSLVSPVITLDGEPWSAGLAITEEGTHQLEVRATDCAGNVGVATRELTIDLTPPRVSHLDPAEGSILHEPPDAWSGEASEALGRARLIDRDGRTRRGDVDGRRFTFANPVEGDLRDRFVLELTDSAGHTSSTDWNVEIDSEAPAVQIVENGTPISPGRLFRRTVVPEIVSDDRDANISATLNGQTFNSGDSVADEGEWEIAATARDALGHEGRSSVAFSIDTTPPVMAITSPQAGSMVEGSLLDVAGTATGADRVSVNGSVAQLIGSNWSATVRLEQIDTVVRAVATDAAGNRAVDSIEIDRPPLGGMIVVTSPLDGSLTNRRETVVAGFVSRELGASVVRVSKSGGPTEDLIVESDGRFRGVGWPLDEGMNLLELVASGTRSAETSVSVEADMTPPELRILADGTDLGEGDALEVPSVLSLHANDSGGQLTTTLRIDGRLVGTPYREEGRGWRTAVATATDRAGNQTRVERRFRIGGSDPGRCVINNLEPLDGTVVQGVSVQVAARVAGADAITIDGVVTAVEDGSFCTTVALPSAGESAVTIRCLDGEGTPFGEPAALTLLRAEGGGPAVTLTAPARGTVTAAEGGRIEVRGTASNAVEVRVNRNVAAFDGSGYASEVGLSRGVNLISVDAIDAIGRKTHVTSWVRYAGAAPSIEVTSPAGELRTGSSTVQVSGIWRDLDPETLRIGAGPPEIRQFSDTHGSFVFHDVPVPIGSSTLEVSGRDTLNRLASRSVDVLRDESLPWVEIDEPSDQERIDVGSGRIVVRGRGAGAAGAVIDVNGKSAVVESSTAPPGSSHPVQYAFEAEIDLSEISPITPVVARITEPDGLGVSRVISVRRLGGSVGISSVIPADGEVGVETTILPLIRFETDMERGSVRASFALRDESGVRVDGDLWLDGRVLSFVPQVPLQPGTLYELVVGAGASTVAGATLGESWVSRFTTIDTAPSDAPLIDSVGDVCGEAVVVTGTAPAGARVRIEHRGIMLSSEAAADGRWSVALPLDGPDGYRLVRARVEAPDGTLSPAASRCFRVRCDRFTVLGSSFDRSANEAVVELSAEPDPASLTAGAVRLETLNGSALEASVSGSGPKVSVRPVADLSGMTFVLRVDTGLMRLDGAPLAATYERTFYASGDDPVAGDGAGVAAGAVRSGESGRPLDSATITVAPPPKARAEPQR